MLAAAVAAACVAYDPAAFSAEPKLALLLFVGVVGSAFALVGSGRARASTPVLVLCVLAGWLGLSSRAGAGEGGSAPAIWAAAAVVGLLAGRLRRSEAQRAAELACVAVGGIVGAVAVVEAALGHRGMSITGFVGNPNWLGLLMLVTLLPSLAVCRRTLRERTATRGLFVASVLAQAAGLVLGQSRVAWVALAVGALVWLVASRTARAPGRWIVGALVAVSLVLAFGPSPGWMSSEGAGAGASLAGRLWIWRATGAAALEALPFGTGPGGFGAAFLDAQGAQLASLDVAGASRRFTNATTAHNELLHTLTELGPLGLLALGALLVTGIEQLARRWSAGAAAVAACAVASVADSPLHVPAIAVLLAMVLAAAPRTWRLRPARPWASRAVWAATLVSSALLLASTSTRWRAARLLTASKDAGPPERMALLDRAVRVAPASGAAAFEHGLSFLEVGRFDAALSELRRSRDLLPNVGTDVAIGNAHLRAGRPLDAKRAYERALARHPGSFRAHANAAVAFVELRDHVSAERHLRAARRLYPGHPKLARIAEQLSRARIDLETASIDR